MCIAEIWYEQWNPKVCRDPRSWRPVTTNNSGSVQQLGEVLRKTCPPPAAGRWGAEYTVSLGKAHARPQNGCGPQQRAATLGGSK